MRDKRRFHLIGPLPSHVLTARHRHHRPPQRRQVDPFQPADRQALRARLRHAGPDARQARGGGRPRRQSRDHRRHRRPRAGEARLDRRTDAPAERGGARCRRDRGQGPRPDHRGDGHAGHADAGDGGVRPAEAVCRCLSGVRPLGRMRGLHLRALDRGPVHPLGRDEVRARHRRRAALPRRRLGGPYDLRALRRRRWRGRLGPGRGCHGARQTSSNAQTEAALAVASARSRRAVASSSRHRVSSSSTRGPRQRVSSKDSLNGASTRRVASTR